ncbi:MAG: HAD family hydrolase [Candidatus Doudnabacteria bacterium]|nr:HAD family hydrolase [Candidatus Doudnabacteria bacterium]
MSIKHVWLDFSDTLASINKELHNQLKYKAYAELTGQPLTPELKAEYDVLYTAQISNAAVFQFLGAPANFWTNQLNTLDPNILYTLVEPNAAQYVQQLRERVPVSIFSNIQLDSVLPALGFEPNWFTHILKSKPKPALEGFYKIVELSNLQPHKILYVGDQVGKDILPAKQVGLTTGLIYSQAPEADYNFETLQDIFKLLESQP